MNEEQLKQMKLGEVIITDCWQITRVYNGWIYSTYKPSNAVFVPEHQFNYNYNQ